jgi:enterochelin esterase-like enzyme
MSTILGLVLSNVNKTNHWDESRGPEVPDHRRFGMRWAMTAVCSLLPTLLAMPPASSDLLTLRSQVFHNTRHLRVLLPPSYDDPANATRRYPVCYFFDGIAAFDAWGVPKVAPSLWRSGAIPPAIFVGIDNGGSTVESKSPGRDRAQEYLPYADQSWTGADAPAPLGTRLPAFLFDEVVPLVNARYRTSASGADTMLAGDSYAGAAALYVAMTEPGRLSALLLESPALHIGGGRLLRDARAINRWPARVYLGVGTAEGATLADQQEMLSNVRQLHALIALAHPEVRLNLEVAAGAAHGYDAWRQRLPGALRFVFGR